MGGDERDFSSVGFRRMKAIRFGLLIAVLGLLLDSMASSIVTGVVEVYMVIVVGLMCVFGIGLVRSLRAGIRLTDAGVEVRTAYSTKRWPWDAIKRARAYDKTLRESPFLVGFSKMLRRDERLRIHPILDLTNGRDARLYGLQMVASDVHQSAWIDDAVIEINRTLAARRGDPDPSTPRPR
jgi:hypothetical protein